jgi:hypothetical protein
VKAKLRVGVHQDVQVTSTHWGQRLVKDPEHLVTQVFCSACSVAYSHNGVDLWAPFASLILEAAYEATLWTSLLHALRRQDDPGARVVFLTALGGGVFGNSMSWIAHALDLACTRVLPFCATAGITLDLRFVTYAPPVDTAIDEIVSKYAACEEPTTPVQCQPNESVMRSETLLGNMPVDSKRSRTNPSKSSANLSTMERAKHSAVVPDASAQQKISKYFTKV